MPVKAARDHEVEDKPEIALEADTDAFPQSPEAHDSLAESGVKRRARSTQQKRADDTDGFESLTENAPFKCFEVDGDVWQFWHAVSRFEGQPWCGEHRTTVHIS